MNTAEVINQVLRGTHIPGKWYPRRLQPELQEWYAYTIDGGHTIVCAI